jgi:hypothetical protein
MKNYLAFEDQRNVDGKETFRRLLERAFKAKKLDLKGTMVAHHIVFEVDDDAPNEIPSADTLIFDHDIMGAVFGADKAGMIMRTLVMRAPELREKVLKDFLDALDLEEKKAA